MPKRTEPFQALIYQIQYQVQELAEVSESPMLVNFKTGTSREVDITVTINQGGIDIVIGFECVARKRRADAGWVEQMIEKHRNLSTNSLVLVSKSGFTKEAFALVEKEPVIQAITLEDALSTNWSATIDQMQDLKFVGFESTIVQVKIDYDGPNEGISLEECRIVDEHTKKPWEVFEFAKQLLRSEQAYVPAMDAWQSKGEPKKFEFDLTFEPTTVHTYSVIWRDQLFPIGKIRLHVISSTRISNLRLAHASFLGRRVAYGQIKQALPSDDPESVLQVALTQGEGEKYRANVARPGVKGKPTLIFQARVPDQRESLRESDQASTP